MRGIAGVAFRSINSCLSRQCYTSHFAKPLSTASPSGGGIGDKETSNSLEPEDEFEQRIFGGISGNSSVSDSFFQKLDRLQKARNSPGSILNEGSRSHILDGLDESFSTLSDGVDGKLRKAATYFEVDPEEEDQEDFAFRPDMNFWPGSTYDIKDLDLTKPGVRKPPKRYEFNVTTEEVLRKADFRNVRFLANFITEAGIIIKRSKTGISAKAQRKVAREIKTARAFGLLPFTTMGTKSFVFGKTMEDKDEDFEYEIYDGDMVDEANEKDPIGS